MNKSLPQGMVTTVRVSYHIFAYDLCFSRCRRY